jgi:hypothetical protein
VEREWTTAPGILRDCAKRSSYVRSIVKVKKDTHTYRTRSYKEVKCTLVQALRLCTGRTAHRGSRGVALPFHDHGTRRGEGSAARPGRSLPPGKTRYPL